MTPEKPEVWLNGDSAGDKPHAARTTGTRAIIAVKGHAPEEISADS
jgi:hypothetical protein